MFAGCADSVAGYEVWGEVETGVGLYEGFMIYDENSESTV